MRATIVVTLAFGILLSSCNQSPVPTSGGPRNQGRFAGIGVFDAGRLWAEMTASTSKADAALARIEDDEHVIVVLDSHTGEVRQCGDHSGYCVAMNPWSGKGAQNILPVKLTKHASDLAAEDRANADNSAK